MNKQNTKRAKGKLQEFGGSVKRNVGQLIGNEQMEAEGRVAELKGQVAQESAKATERVKGAVEEVAGSVKSSVGQLIGNQQMEIEGEIKERKGKLRQAANE